MFAMHLAAHTERIRVGSAVVVLPLHHPLVVFEEIATADLLSRRPARCRAWAVAISATSLTASVTHSTRAGNASTSPSTFC